MEKPTLPPCASESKARTPTTIITTAEQIKDLVHNIMAKPEKERILGIDCEGLQVEQSLCLLQVRPTARKTTLACRSPSAERSIYSICLLVHLKTSLS